MSELAAHFEIRYATGATIRTEFVRPADHFSITALFGPSGCGKTTVLRSLAGLERPQHGSIQFRGQIWMDAERGIHRSPPQRNIGFLFQDYALFPHLTVAQNVGYGLRRLPSKDRHRRVAELLERFGLSDLDRRFPREVSSGQQQRVALARTLACKPDLLLLDEPLSALDTALREQLRLQLRSLLADFDIPVILVTHDRHEVAALADHLIVMNEGHVLQSGPVEDVFSRPASEQVAHMVGVETVVSGHIAGRDSTKVTVNIGAATLFALANETLGDEVIVCIRADDVEIDPGPVSSSHIPNCLASTICEVLPAGAVVRLALDCGFRLSALVPRPFARSHNLAAGKKVMVHVPNEAIHLISQAPGSNGP